MRATNFAMIALLMDLLRLPVRKSSTVRGEPPAHEQVLSGQPERNILTLGQIIGQVCLTFSRGNNLPWQRDAAAAT
ncbi:hypothetical protein ABID26_007244 [Mesorhizobium shonense]|uniref:Secreted protein n=1 Tax=Mesorhizobium shonense TaxID=1209948 RepID=A0ABV2I4M6_9HYPH